MIIAQTLVDKAPSFCLCFYGTCSKFTAKDVEKGWIKTVEAKACDIMVEGFFMDVD